MGRAILVVFASGVPFAAGCSGAPSDGEIVYCLSAAHLSQLVESATTLRLVNSPGLPGLDARDVSAVARWGTEHAADLERACSAIQPLVSGSDQLLTSLFGIANVVVGAALATGTSLLTLRLTGRRQAAEGLRDALADMDALIARLKSVTSEINAPERTVREERLNALRRAKERARGAVSRRRAGPNLTAELDDFRAALLAIVPDLQEQPTWRANLDERWAAVRDPCTVLLALLDRPFRIGRRRGPGS